jgi:hypothetical protein
LIYNTHHEYNAGLTIVDGGSTAEEGNYLVENNLIWNIHKVKYGVAGIAIGHGKAIIRNNIIWGIDGGWGIRLCEGFSNPKALTVVISNNTIYTGPGAERIAVYGGAKPENPNPLKPILDVQNTYTDDGSAGSTQATPDLFVGPLTGDADAGSGPGSGFELKAYKGIGADYSKIKGGSSGTEK